jgi:hypothetical protein
MIFPTMPKKLTDLFIRYEERPKLTDVTFHCLRDTYISRLAPHVTTPTLMALARRRGYRTKQCYVQVGGDHLRAAVERLAVRGCHSEAALIDCPLKSVNTPESTP